MTIPIEQNGIARECMQDEGRVDSPQWIVFVDVHVSGYGSHGQHLEASPSQGVDALAASRRLGLRVAVVSAQPASYGSDVHDLVDRWIICDARDPDAVAAAVRDARIDVVTIITLVDTLVDVAARAAQTLELDGATPTGIAVAREKPLVRHALDEAGVPNARWAVISDVEDVDSSPIGYPCIAKPVDGTASWDVARVDSDEELRQAFEHHTSRSEYVRGIQPKRRLLLEEELVGPLYSAEGVVARGDVEIWGYTDRQLSDPPHYFERGGTFGGDPPVEEADALVHDVLRATGYDVGPFHLEFIVTDDGPRLVELNPRLTGGGWHESLDLVCQTGIVEHVLSRQLGHTEQRVSASMSASSAMYIYPAKSGLVTAINGVDEARAADGIHRVALQVELGDTVHAPRSNSDCVGHVVSVGGSRAEAEHRAVRALELIEVEVEPDSRSRGRARLTVPGVTLGATPAHSASGDWQRHVRHRQQRLQIRPQLE